MKPTEEIEYKIVKLVVIGDGQVGKTSLILRYVNQLFTSNQKHTNGVFFQSKQVKIGRETVSLQIYDTGNHEGTKCLPKLIYHSMDGIIIAFAINSLSSFDKAKEWYRDIKKDTKTETCFLLVGCKSDLEPERQVTTFEAYKYAKENKIDYIESSACTNSNVDLLFENLAKAIVADKIVNYSLPIILLPPLTSNQPPNSKQQSDCV